MFSESAVFLFFWSKAINWNLEALHQFYCDSTIIKFQLPRYAGGILVTLLRALLSKGSNRKSHNHNFRGNSYSFICFDCDVFLCWENREFQNLTCGKYSVSKCSCGFLPLLSSSRVFPLRWRGRSSTRSWMPLIWLQNDPSNSCGICTSLNLIYLGPLWEQRSLPSPGSHASIFAHAHRT